MSLLELTQNSFQTGISATKWLKLCKLFIAKQDQSDSEVQNNLTSGYIQHPDRLAGELCSVDSVLHLYRSYPGDPDLQEYLRCAIQDGILSVASFVSTFLHRVAQTSELHHPVTLDALIRIALDAHLSGLPYSESGAAAFNTVQDALVLLRTTHSLPVASHFHQVTASASELVILLLSGLSDLSQISAAQAMHFAAIANDLLSTIRVSPDVRQVLESLILSLSLLIGDDTKVVQEAQMMHTILGKGDIVGPSSSNTDIVTFGLELRYLVTFRASKFGAGNDRCCVALLLATFRWLRSWTPASFYSQLLVAAFVCLSQSSPSFAGHWKAWIIGRLPHILITFEKTISSQSESTVEVDWRSAMQAAIAAVFRRPELISHCELVLSRSNEQPEASSRSLWRDFVQQLLSAGLLDHRFAIAVDPSIANDSTSRLLAEARDIGLELESYMHSKLLDGNRDESRSWLSKVFQDPACHATFADVVFKSFVSLVETLDVETLSRVCQFLQSNEVSMDIFSLQKEMSDIIFHGLSFLEQYDCETVGDPQTALAHVGDVVLFLQSLLLRFDLPHSFSLGGKTLSASHLLNEDCYLPEDLTGEEAGAFNSWFKTLFDSNSEGIDDTILRSTRPKTLLRIAPVLFSRALAEMLDGRLDGDALNNGIAYFTTPLLSWTLVDVLKSLLNTFQHRGLTTQLEVLQNLVVSDACPRPVIILCGPRILALFSGKQSKTQISASGFDPSRLIGKITAIIRENTPAVTMPGNPLTWQHSKQAIQEALAMARAGKAPFIDINRCLKLCPPSRFLELLWAELATTAALETEICRRLATFILTMPRTTTADCPPLLPIFLHRVVPGLVLMLEGQQPSEQAANIELLVTLLSSAMTAALHLELALRSLAPEIAQQSILGQSTTSMARRLAVDLKQSQLRVGKMVAQRLSSSQSFATNFPVFMGELAI